MSSLGMPGLGVFQKKEPFPTPVPPGPPFLLTSADNGLSVDATSRRIVLGNDVGDPLAPAVLLTDREIPVRAGLNLFLIDPAGGGNQLVLGPTQINMSDLAGNQALLFVSHFNMSNAAGTEDVDIIPGQLQIASQTGVTG